MKICFTVPGGLQMNWKFTSWSGMRHSFSLKLNQQIIKSSVCFLQLKTQEKNLDPFKIKRRDYTHAYMDTHAPLYVYLCEDFHRHNELRSPLNYKQPSYPPEPNPDLNPILTLTFKAISKFQTVFWSFDLHVCPVFWTQEVARTTHTHTHTALCVPTAHSCCSEVNR